jgi:DNA-binding NarL/FixJ family response regulator
VDGPLRIVIAEDSYLVREGTRRLLEDSGQVDVVAAVGTPGELLDAVERLHPAAVITDIRMPPDHHMEGIDAAHAIRARHPEIGVVVLSQHSEEAYAFRLFRDGTSGLAYVLKERLGSLDSLVAAVREVVAGGSVVDPKVVEVLVARRAREVASPLGRLTPRELAVLREMAQGRSNRSIGDSLHLSESAVEKHVSSILGKLDLEADASVHRRVAAVLTFLRESEGRR